MQTISLNCSHLEQTELNIDSILRVYFGVVVKL